MRGILWYDKLFIYHKGLQSNKKVLQSKDGNRKVKYKTRCEVKRAIISHNKHVSIHVNKICEGIYIARAAQEKKWIRLLSKKRHKKSQVDGNT